MIFKKIVFSLLSFIFIGLFALYEGSIFSQSFSNLNLNEFKSLMVHEGGRLKPIDTLAKTTLLSFSGRSRYKGELAISWFARLVFLPETTGGDKIFRINHPEIIDALSLKKEKKHRYSLKQIISSYNELIRLVGLVFEKEEEQRDLVEKEMIRLYGNLQRYLSFVSSFSFTKKFYFPALEDEIIRKQIGVSKESKANVLYLDLFSNHQEMFLKILSNYQNKKQSSFTEQDWRLLSFLVNYFGIQKNATQANFLKIIPSGHVGFEWFAPWQVLSSGISESKGLLYKLNQVANAYRRGNQQDFDTALMTFKSDVLSKTEIKKRLAKRNHLEVFYNQLNPFGYAKLFYFLSLMSLLFSFLKLRKVLSQASLVSLVLGFGIHLFGMGLRVVITQRPPISNLFDTFVFVSMMTVILGFVVEFLNKERLGLVCASIGGLILLLISGRFAAEGDTMGVLVAVLRSNFWLLTHVIAINLGYSGIIFSGLVAHFYLFSLLQKKSNPEKERHLFRFIYGIQGFGLLFTFLGTILGGIWADQSWGRFWGWDPKENGALLIVIWSAILFHAKMGGIIGNLGFAAGAVFNIIVVILAWFGINLLGVGLHSYGFTSGLGFGVFAYIGLQLSLLFFLLYLIFRKKEKQITA